MTAEDESPSLDKLRSMQHSIMKRRNAMKREVSTSADGNDFDDGSLLDNLPEAIPVFVEGPDVDPGKEARRKQGRPRKNKAPAVVSSPGIPNNVDASQNSEVQDAPHFNFDPLAIQSEGPTQILAELESLSLNSGHVEGHKQLTNEEPLLSAPLNEREDHVSLDYGTTLMRLDGSLPTRVPRDNHCENAHETVFIVPMKDFTSDTLQKCGNGRLPRIGTFKLPFAQRKTCPDANPSERSRGGCDKILQSLNQVQVEAVTAPIGKPCLILAGPGSGKTRVLTHRAAYLVRNYNVAPYRIMAVTFTNKAADEMKSRLRGLLDDASSDESLRHALNSDFAVGTFHSICARLLRVYGSAIGIQPDFQICDSSDSRQIIMSLLRGNATAPDAEKLATKAAILATLITKLKNNGEREMEHSIPASRLRELLQYRALYDEKLRAMNQLDFDDLLLETRRMLREAPEVLRELQDYYQHVLVDEWQDTNTVQFDIVTILANRLQNLFVVGDPDQSIYKFRGADIRNISRFTTSFPDANIVALEENYRSTACIVSAAQSVIEANLNRPGKAMRAMNAFGDQVVVCKASDGRAEASYIVKRIKAMLRNNSISSLSDVAVLYRMNAQTRLIEEACINAGIRYRLVAGTRFFDRQEVKDVLSYMRIIANPTDDLSMLRVINVPPRGIGKKTVEALQAIAASKGASVFAALEAVCSQDWTGAVDEGTTSVLRKSAIKKLAEFLIVLNRLRESDDARAVVGDPDSQDIDNGGTAGNVANLVATILDVTQYKEYLQRRSEGGADLDGKKFDDRWRNVLELQSAASKHSFLRSFLQSVALLSQPADEADDAATEEGQTSAVSLMTLHAGKGLEFAAVFIAGVEDGLLPMKRRDDSGEDTIEEERRLAYVGMTRAKQYLTLTWRARMQVFAGGKAIFWSDGKPSRFIADIPDQFIATENFSLSKQGEKGRKVSKVARKSPRPDSHEWQVGDSVRCPEHGRGTIVTSDGHGAGGVVEVLFTNGGLRTVHPEQSRLELLYSPALYSQ